VIDGAKVPIVRMEFDLSDEKNIENTSEFNLNNNKLCFDISVNLVK